MRIFFGVFNLSQIENQTSIPDYHLRCPRTCRKHVSFLDLARLSFRYRHPDRLPLPALNSFSTRRLVLIRSSRGLSSHSASSATSIVRLCVFTGKDRRHCSIRIVHLSRRDRSPSFTRHRPRAIQNHSHSLPHTHTHPHPHSHRETPPHRYSLNHHELLVLPLRSPFFSPSRVCSLFRGRPQGRRRVALHGISVLVSSHHLFLWLVVFDGCSRRSCGTGEKRDLYPAVDRSIGSC